MLKKTGILIGAAVLAFSSVACNRGPSEAFCDAAADLVVALEAGDNIDTTAPAAEIYAQLDASVAEVVAILERMENETDDEEVDADLAVVREAFENFQETNDPEATESSETKEAADDIEDYAEQNCEDVEFPEDEAS